MKYNIIAAIALCVSMNCHASLLKFKCEAPDGLGNPVTLVINGQSEQVVSLLENSNENNFTFYFNTYRYCFRFWAKYF